MKCQTCQSEIKAERRFCNVCGHPISLNPELEDIHLSRLTASSSSLLAHKVRSASYLSREQRTVTAIMFTMTDLITNDEQIDTETRFSLFNNVLSRLARHIIKYEGHIAKVWKNSALVFFGAPITHENDPLRALHTANAILDETRTISDEFEISYGNPLHIKLVINTGPIMIGEVKTNHRFDFRSLNNTLECMDLALQANIPTDEVILFEDTYRYIKPFVESTELEEVHCEELDETIKLWLLQEVQKSANHIKRSPFSQNVPIIGRVNELDQLMELSETVLAGLGRVGLILGEPGIGKTRLIIDWKYKIKSQHLPVMPRWVEAQGMAFGRELAYHLLKNLVRSTLNIPAMAPEEHKNSLLLAAIHEIPELNEDKAYPFLAHLLDIKLPEEAEEQIHQMSARDLRSKYLETIKPLLKYYAQQQPLFIILEDLHWADTSSVEILSDLLLLASSTPVLFCLTSRMDRETHGWNLILTARQRLGPRRTEIHLDSLNSDESELLVANLIEIDEIPNVIRELVLEKSEGNPFFIEELVRNMVNEGVLFKKNDRWVIKADIESEKIPDSLQGLLTARVDRLPSEAKLTLRIASVIGRTFPEHVLERVVTALQPDIHLMEQLSILESNGLINVAQVKPELVYSFQHILLHDAVYNAIVESDRKEVHLNVGKALEVLYPDQQKRLASQLGHHFLNAEEKDKAFYYLDLAGHVAMDAYANAEAAGYYSQAIVLSDDDKKLAHLYTDLGEALSQQSKHRAAIKAWEKAIHYHRKVGDTDRLARVYAWAARSAWWGYEPKRSLEICLEGVRAVENAVESPDIAYLVHETGRAYLFNNQPDKARAFCEKALEIAKRLEAYDVQAEALATLGILPNMRPEQAISALEMAVKISESNELFGPAARAYTNLAAVIDKLGEIRLARDYRMRALQLGEQIGGISDEFLINQTIINASLWLADFEDAGTRINRMHQSIHLENQFLDDKTLTQILIEGNYYRYMGNITDAIERFTELIDRSRQTDNLEHLLEGNRALAETILESFRLQGDDSNISNVDIALSMINEVIKNDTEKDQITSVALFCLLANIHMLKGNYTKAEKALQEANSLYRAQPAMQDRVRIILSQARLAYAQNNYTTSLKLLEEVVTLLEKMEGRWWRARIWVEMGIVYLQRNEPEDIDQAQTLFRDALSEFKEMGVEYYPDVIVDKLRQVKQVSRAQAIAHHKISQELAQAGRVQHTFIPTHSPEIPGYDISGVLLPARETSGDFYDFIDLENGNLGIAIADVGDKGAGAALYMAMSRTLLRTYANEISQNPKEVICEVNRRILTDTQHGIFLTVVFGVLDPDQGKFTYVNAGHNPPLILQQTDSGVAFTQLEKTGSLVGIFQDHTWTAETISLNPGEILILYTDGITEAQDEAGEFFGNQRLYNMLETGYSLDAEGFRNHILESVQAFCGSAPRLDDITLIVISRERAESRK